VINCKNADKEDGPNVEFQVSFDSPEFLDWAFSPQPYLIASVNTAGDTSYGGAGLEWRWDVSEHWAIEPGVGYVVHNGEIENPYPNGSPEAAAFAAEHVQFGSRDLFRTSLGVTYDFDGPWEAEVLYEHLSHGQILGSGRNQGIDNIGVRIGYQFGA
jgi:lipid A 3-O-deacylase